MSLIERFIAKDTRALARAITMVENLQPGAIEFLRSVYERSGRAHLVGITGPPGAGKSTLTDRLALAFREKGFSVAIMAVDPSSPFTGGALLGDRIRMQSMVADAGVYMRSLASRGDVGGLTRAADDVATLLDAFGFDVILIETVGAGQTEVAIMELAHTTCVVSVPGLGDEIQAIKAGILEIGDVFAVNKSDRPGADGVVADLESMLKQAYMGRPGINHWKLEESRTEPVKANLDPTGHHRPNTAMGRVMYNRDPARDARHGSAEPGNTSWRPPVHKVVALENRGVDELLASIQSHLEFIRTTGRWEARQHSVAEARLRRMMGYELLDRAVQRAQAAGEFQQWVERVAARTTDPYTAVDKLLAAYWSRA